jgi:predicted acylesterase/phospholipase RssA
MSIDWISWATAITRDWAWGVFLNGFCLNLVRPLVVLLPLAIIFLNMGRGLGLPQLFRKKSWWDQLWMGAGVGVLIWQALLAGFLFEQFATNYTADRPPFCERKPDSTKSFFSFDQPNFDSVKEVPLKQRRYVMPPSSALSIVSYAGAVLIGAVVMGLALVLGVLLIRSLITIYERLTKSYGTYTIAPVPTPKLPSVGLIFIGILLGYLGMAGAAYLLLPNRLVDDKLLESQPLPVHQKWIADIGERMIASAGYGNADARSKVWHELSKKDVEVPTHEALQKIREKAQNETRETFFHYYPVIGLFVVGFLLSSIVNLWFISDPKFAQKLVQKLRGHTAVAKFFSPAAGVIFLLHIVLFLQTIFDYFFPYPQLLYIGLILLGWLMARQYKLRHQNVRASGQPLKSLDGYGATIKRQYVEEKTNAPSPLLKAEDLLAWNTGQKRPMVIVCASGGGSRAAAWTLKVITELEARIQAKTPDCPLPYHTRLITGASGGMVGMSHYVSHLTAPEANGQLPASRDDAQRAHLNRQIRGDFLTPVIHALITRDIPGYFLPRVLPYFRDYDRGQALEFALTETMGHLSTPLFELRERERAGWCPSLLFSPMMIEDGRQLLISNLDLQKIVHNEGAFQAGQPRELLSREGVEFFRLFPEATKFQIATAARMSATFPYVFPAVPLPTDPRRRVVDAGYYDNYGVSLAASWVFNHLDWIKQNVSKLAILQIRDGLSEAERLLEHPSDVNPGWRELGMEWLTGVPQGLYNARVSSNMFRNDNLLHLLHQTFQLELGTGFLVSPAFEFPGGSDVQLNFCLTEEEGKLIDGEAGIGEKRVQQAMEAFVKWW